MRLRHFLSSCAVLPLLATLPGAAVAGPPKSGTATKAASSAMSPAEIAAARKAVQRMIEEIDIPYREFTLPNGLRTLVHTDRNDPKVYVGMFYDVGSKHEQPGRSGFAHLFEHLMFNGSENVPGDYLLPLTSIGGDVNGTTSPDRTNYYAVVPPAALDRALFMESDRMGHLLGALSQATLDEQRGVVQNEKRRGADSPLSIMEPMGRRVLYPEPHPYDHSIIGSMKDLNAATLDDVRTFFKEHYGPNNAVLILSGNVDFENAKRLVSRYFAAIPAGPRNVRPTVQATPLSETIRETVTAPFNGTIIKRVWSVPGKYSKDALTLDAVSMALGRAEAPMIKHLVHEQKLFMDLSADNTSQMHAGEFYVGGRVAKGVDPKVASAALDREIATFLKAGTTTDVLTSWLASYAYGVVGNLDSAPARGAWIGEALMGYGDPMAVKNNLRFYASVTPADVLVVANKWLRQPYWELTVTPGPRVTPPDDAGMDGTGTDTTAETARSSAPVDAQDAVGNRGPLPPVGPPVDTTFPRIERATLANGIQVTYAHVDAMPFTKVGISIEGGWLQEPAGQIGTMSMMYALMEAGYGRFDKRAIRERAALLGIKLSALSMVPGSTVSLEVPNANLMPGLEMMGQMLTAPAFPADLIERAKLNQLNGLENERQSIDTLVTETLLPLIDAGSPHNRLYMYRDADVIRRINRTALMAAFHRWVRPERAQMQVVSNKPLAELLPALNRTIGTWKASTPLTPMPQIHYQPKPAGPQIVLIDVPDAVQASITGGQLVPLKETDPVDALNIASSVLGAGFNSRINTNLREDKHWSYGADGGFERRPYSSRYIVGTTVQQDKAGPAIAEIMKEVRDILTDRPITPAEFERMKTRGLGMAAGMYAGPGGIASGLEETARDKRPDSYVAGMSARIRAVALADANARLREQLDPGKWIWVVAGNAKLIRPQLDSLGLPVRVVKREDILPPKKQSFE